VFPRHTATDKMPKRKRDDLQEKLEHHSTALFRALKAAKGFERQRMAKRQRDPKSTREKRARIEKEIEVLKVRTSETLP
jgi:hypothetical protein